ncbi:MAG: diacylglycerol kinase family protein [bacterium]
MSKKEYFVIINPNAGKGLSKMGWQEISSLLDDNNLEYQHQFSEYRGHSIKIAREKAIEGYKNFIVVGGDGTLNEVINGIVSISESALNGLTFAMIPVGTGNDWCRSYNIPNNFKDAISLIKQGKTITQDLAKATYFENEQILTRYFANISGIGFDAHVAIKSNLDKQMNKSGIFVYLKNVISSLINYQSVKSTVIYDDKQIDCKLFLLSAGKGKFNGGGMKQLPLAVPDDGFIDFTLIQDISKFDVITQLPKLYNGTHIYHPKISTYKARKLSITTDKKIFLEVDGETFGHSPFIFEVIPSALTVICGL